MDHKRSQEYLRGLVEYDSSLLEQLEREAGDRDDIQPFLEKELCKLLGLLLRWNRPRRVLEVGSGIGYSTLYLANAVHGYGGRVTAVDYHERTAVEARANFERAKLSESIEFIQEDARTALPRLRQEGRSFDLIFQDCGKYVYEAVYEEIYQLLSDGGLLITDDTLLNFDPSVRPSLGQKTDSYNRRLFSDRRYYSTMLAAGQGIAFSWKQDRKLQEAENR